MLAVCGSCPENGKWMILSRRRDQSEELVEGLDFAVCKASWPSLLCAVQLPLLLVLSMEHQGVWITRAATQSVGTAIPLWSSTHMGWCHVVLFGLLPPWGLLRTWICEHMLLSAVEGSIVLVVFVQGIGIFCLPWGRESKSSVCSPRSRPGFWGQAKS